MNNTNTQSTVGDFFKCLLNREEYCKELAENLQGLNIMSNGIDIGNKLSGCISTA